MKILVLMTGGTIGSTVNDGWISPDKSTKYVLIEQYVKKFGNDISFETREPYFMLSENLSAKNLNLLISSIENGLNEDFDGIIVTHGTDTLHFSAAAAHLAFSGSDTPIVFVSANLPLENKLSNGHANFEGAVGLIKSGIKSGVYISYKNPNGKHFIHNANKALSFSENDDCIYSLNKQHFGIYHNENVEFINTENDYFTACKTVFCEKPNILVVTTMPSDSFDYAIYKYNAVILRPYHSGTLNTENAEFKAFMQVANERDIPVFLANAPSGTTYETAKEYEKLGVIPLPDSTLAYVYIKLWYGISQNKNLKNLF